MADSGHPPAELHERLLICRTIKLNAGAHGGHQRCCHAQMQKNAQNKPQIARLILCVHTTLQVYCNLFLTFCPYFYQLQQLGKDAVLHDETRRGQGKGAAVKACIARPDAVLHKGQLCGGKFFPVKFFVCIQRKAFAQTQL